MGVEPSSGVLPGGSACPAAPPTLPLDCLALLVLPQPVQGSLLPLLPQRGSVIGRREPGDVLRQAVGVSLGHMPAGSWAVGVPQLGLLSQEAQSDLPAPPGHPCVSHVSSTQRPVAPMRGPHNQAEPPAECLVCAHLLPGHQADPGTVPFPVFSVPCFGEDSQKGGVGVSCGVLPCLHPGRRIFPHFPPASPFS